MAATAALTLEEIRKGLAWRKQFDKVFVLVGLAVLFGCLAILAILFVTQLFFFNTTVRIGYGCAYLLLALLVFFRDRPTMPVLWRTAREAISPPHSGSGDPHKPPG